MNIGLIILKTGKDYCFDTTKQKFSSTTNAFNNCNQNVGKGSAFILRRPRLKFDSINTNHDRSKINLSTSAQNSGLSKATPTVNQSSVPSVCGRAPTNSLALIPSPAAQKLAVQDTTAITALYGNLNDKNLPSLQNGNSSKSSNVA